MSPQAPKTLYNLDPAAVPETTPVAKKQRTIVRDSAQTGEVERPSHLSWTIKSSFKCPICSDVIWGRDRLRLHCLEKHEVQKAREELDDMVRGKFHTCFLCGEKMLHDTLELTVHLSVTHERALDDYAQQHQMEVQAPVHLSGSHQRTPDDYAQQDQMDCQDPVNEPSETGEFPGFPDKGDDSGSSAAAPVTPDETTRSGRKSPLSNVVWYDLCVVQCQGCPKTFPNTGCARQHTKSTKHGGFKYILKTKYSCKLCQSVLICYKTNIAKHLRRAHNTSFDEYTKRYEGMDSTRSDLIATAPKEDLQEETR
jgi:hypothetical protein